MTHPSTIPPAAPAPVAEDLPCIHCHYNLRTLPPSAKCPECATPVVTSIAYHTGRGSLDLVRLRRGARGILVYFLLVGIELLVMAMASWMIWAPWSPPAWMGLEVLRSAAIFIGMVQLSKCKPGVHGRRFLWFLCLLLPFAYLALGIVVATYLHELPPVSVWFWLIVAGAFVQMLEVVVGLLGIFFMRDLAEQWQRPFLRRVTPWVFGVFGLLSLMRLLICAHDAAAIAAIARGLPPLGSNAYWNWIVVLNWIDTYAYWIGPVVMTGYWFGITRAASRAAREVAMPKEQA